MNEPKHLRIDPNRRVADLQNPETCCGYYAPAFDEHGHTRTAAIEELDKESLLVWLQTRATREYVEDVVATLLGHGRFERPAAEVSTSRRFTPER